MGVYDKKRLTKNEKIVQEIQLSNMGLINPILWTVLTFGIGLPVSIYKYLKFIKTEQIITNKKVIKKQELFHKTLMK